MTVMPISPDDAVNKLPNITEQELAKRDKLYGQLDKFLMEQEWYLGRVHEFHVGDIYDISSSVRAHIQKAYTKAGWNVLFNKEKGTIEFWIRDFYGRR